MPRAPGTSRHGSRAQRVSTTVVLFTRDLRVHETPPSMRRWPARPRSCRSSSSTTASLLASVRRTGSRSSWTPWPISALARRAGGRPRRSSRRCRRGGDPSRRGDRGDAHPPERGRERVRPGATASAAPSGDGAQDLDRGVSGDHRRPAGRRLAGRGRRCLPRLHALLEAVARDAVARGAARPHVDPVSRDARTTCRFRLPGAHGSGTPPRTFPWAARPRAGRGSPAGCATASRSTRAGATTSPSRAHRALGVPPLRLRLAARGGRACTRGAGRRCLRAAALLARLPPPAARGRASHRARGSPPETTIAGAPIRLRSRRGRKGAPAIRSSMQGCGSSSRRGRCTTGHGWSRRRSSRSTCTGLAPRGRALRGPPRRRRRREQRRKLAVGRRDRGRHAAQSRLQPDAPGTAVRSGRRVRPSLGAQLEAIDGRAVHEPWRLGLLAPKGYPAPIVDHDEAVRRFLEARRSP